MKKIIYVLIALGITFASCSKKNSINPQYKLDTDKITMAYDDTHQFQVNSNDPNEVWKSSDETVGTVSSTGYFTAKKIGKSTVSVSGNGFNLSALVTIAPESNLCQEPFYLDGSSKSTVKSKENRALVSESETALLYTGENSKVRYVEYIFDTDEMTGAALLLQNTADVVNESMTFFKERYTLIGAQNDVIFFTDNKNTVIGLTIDDVLGYVAIYLKGTASDLSVIKTKNIAVLNQLKISIKNRSGVSHY